MAAHNTNIPKNIRNMLAQSSSNLGPANANQVAQGGRIAFQPWIRLKGVAGAETGDIVQPQEQWIDGLAAEAYQLQGHLIGVTGCTLHIETSWDIAGSGFDSSWLGLVSLAQPGPMPNKLLSSRATSQETAMLGLLRWRVEIDDD